MGRDVLSDQSIAGYYFRFTRIIKSLSDWLKAHDRKLIELEERQNKIEKFILNAEESMVEAEREVKKAREE
jgi:hypothetical protein